MADFTVWLITIVYPTLSVFFFLRGVIRILRYRRVHQDKTLLSGAMVNFTEFVAFSVASLITGVSPLMSFNTVLPWARVCWVFVMIAVVISTLQEWQDWHVFEHMRKKIAKGAEQMNEVQL